MWCSQEMAAARSGKRKPVFVPVPSLSTQQTAAHLERDSTWKAEVSLLESVLPTATAKGLLMILRENLSAMSDSQSWPVSVGMVGKGSLLVLGARLEPGCESRCATRP